MALDGAKFICLSDAAAADATETTPTTTKGVEAGGIGDASASKNIVIEAKGRKFTVGYYMNCDYVLEDPRAIGVHCEIQCDAFGRVTIHNNSEAHPVSVNEQIITLKRPLLDGSRIKILDRNFLWKFPKPLELTATSKSTQDDDVRSNEEVSTPQKLVVVPEQAPNSCPDLKHHRKVDKRFTVHNFAYCINSDEEGNTSSELPNINESDIVEEAAVSELVTQKESNKNEEMPEEDKDILSTSIASQDRFVGKTTLETSNVERRCITPEPQQNEPTIASTPLIKLEDTPKMNLINCTQNKENRSTEKKLRLLSFCQQSDVVITSFSPRETGVRIEKSFTAVIKPATLGSTTPKSVYSTPKSMLSDYNDGKSLNFIEFATPATSKKGAGILARNSSMYLIDLTTPSKLGPDSARHRLAHKGNKTLPSHEKLSTTPISSDKLEYDSVRKDNACLLSRTPTLGTSLNKSESSPQSAESIISVDETSDSSTGVLEISDDSPAPSTSSQVRTGFITKTPQRSTGQKPFTSTPLRTPQSLLKRAIVTSAKKHINSSLRAALVKATPTRQLSPTPALNRKINTTGTSDTTPSKPKSRISIGSPGSEAAAQRRNISSLTRRSSIATSHNREDDITTSSTPFTRFTQNRKIPASTSRLNTGKRTSPLRGVRKSLGGTILTSHISKTHRSVISPRKHSPTSIATKLAAKARKSFIPNSPNNRQVASRAHSLVVAAVSAKNSPANPKTTATTPQKKDNIETVENMTGKEVKNEASLEEQNEFDDLSRTFTVDDSLEEVQIKTSMPSAPCVLGTSTSQKQDLNKTFSPEKSVTGSECKVAETSIESQKEGISEDFNNKDKIIITEHISESFAEVVETDLKIEEKIINFETLEDSVKVEQQNDTVDENPKVSTSPSEQQQDSKLIEEQVIETLDAGEISGNSSVQQQDSTSTEPHVLTPPSSSDTVDSEDMLKQSGESQGTAELLEEIEYVLNKSDELQQQLSKDVHTSHIEVTDEFEAAIEHNLSGKTEDVTTKNNSKTDANINVKVSEAITKDELATSTSLSVVLTSTDRSESQEDASSIDSNMIATASERTSTDLDASSMQAEVLSITSIATPSEFDVYTIESSSVEKSIVPDERETTDENTESSNQENDKIAVDLEAKVSENGTSIKTELSAAGAAEAESVIVVESTTGEVEDIVLTKIEIAEEDSIDKSEVGVVTSINIAEISKDSQTTLELGEEAEQTQAVVITQTEPIVVDNDIQKTVDNNKETDIAEGQPKPITTECQETESVSTEFEECKSVTLESKVEFKTIQDAEKAIDDTKTLSDSSETIAAVSEPDVVVKEKTKPNGENQISTNSERNSDSEKENNILVEEGKQISTSTADETNKISSSELKTSNLCGIRDMLRSPKQKEPTTPRFVGLRNLTCTPKASTSAAAAVVENDGEELIGAQKLLKTPHFAKIKSQTPQKTAEDSKFTPRRSTRRRSSANPELTPTPKSVTETNDTPRRTTRRRASASAEVNYTPQRITRRRSSLALNNEGAADKALTPITRVGLRAKRPGTIADAPVVEDMGAIIEEESKECVQESTDQQDLVEIQKKTGDVKTETRVHDIPEVIEESICEEVNPQKQEVREQKEEFVEVKANKECEKRDKSANEIEPICATEKLDEDVDKAANATESQSQLIQKAQVEEVVADSSSNVSEVHKEKRLTETKRITTDKTDKTAEILDESDYEYGKEVIEQSAATALTDTQPKTPKPVRKSVRIAYTNIAESPKTPVMVGMRELLKTSKDCRDTPMLIGVRDLGRTPKTTIASGTTELADLMKTPKVARKPCENVEATKDNDEPSTSSKALSDFIGMRELLKTPKYTSTPYYSGMREMLRTPKACSTPQLAGVVELMQTPKRTKLNVEYDDKNEELDQFFKTPRAKNIMIPADPASAILEPSSDSSAEIMMAATTEYDLHSRSQRPLEDIYKTPVSTRLTSVEIEQSERKSVEIEVIKDKSSTGTTNEFEVSVPETPAANCDKPQKATTSKRNLSAEEAFDEMVGMRTILDDTPPQKVYSRKQQSIVAMSPFSATDVISDLPKTDIQEWVDNLEQEPESVVEEQEFTASTSILNASKATHDPIAASLYEISDVSVNKDTTEELLADMSAASSMVDPLQPSAMKTTKSVLTIVVDENETLQPVTPINTEISGINLLDRTNESVFSEPLVVSDTESVQLEDDKVETEKTINKSEKEFPIMFVDSSDSEQEEDVKTIEKSDAKKAEVKSPIESVKPMSEEEVIALDDESTSDVTTKPSEILEEFSNFQAHKNIAGQHMRASTPNRSVMQSTRERRQSKGAEELITEVSINVQLEKSRLTKEKSVDATTAKDNLPKIEEESVETSANETDITSVIPDIEKPAAITTTSKDNESDFRNFLANKSSTSREKRGTTPDQVNKSRSQKITQGRRLTQGAEHHLPNATIDFGEEKLKLEQLKQQPPCNDESQLEIDDSFNAETAEVAETEENTADVKISASEPNDTNKADEVEIEDKVDVKTQMDREENAREIEENILDKSLKETEKVSDEPEKDSVQDLQAENSSAVKQPPCMDEIPLERDDSFNAEITEEAETEENTAGVKISTSEPKEIANDTNTAEKVEDEVKVDIKTQMVREKNAREIEENILDKSLKETENVSDEPEKDSVQDLETENLSADKGDAQTIANVAECSAKESQNDMMSSENVEESIANVCESPVVEDLTVGTIKGDNVNKAEYIDTAATGSNLSRKATVSRYDSPTLTLIDEEEIKSKDIEETTESSVSHTKSEDAGNKLEAFKSTDVEEITSVESTKEKLEKLTEITDDTTTTLTEDATKTPEENKPEISNDINDKEEVQSTISIAGIRSEEQNSEEVPGSTKVEKIEPEASSNNENENKAEEEGNHQAVNNVGLEALESQEESPKVALKDERNISSAGNAFDVSDIFDLSEELSNEMPTINTTEDVIFDLTEEDVESTVETNTAENATLDEQKPQTPHDVTKSKPVSPEVANAIQTLKTTETADSKETVENNTNQTNTKSISTKADPEIALSKEVPCQIEIIEKAVKTTAVEELKATTVETSSYDTNTSTDNEAFTLAVSTESDWENVDEMSEVTTENRKSEDAADIKNEVEEQNNQPVRTDIKDIGENTCNTAGEKETLFMETKAISQGKDAKAEVHSDAEDMTEKPAVISTKESTQVDTVETELSETPKLTEDKKAENDSDNTTSNTSTANEGETVDTKFSNVAIRTDIGECVVPEDSISSTISSTAVEIEIANKETKENEAIGEVHEADNGSEQSPRDEVKEETAAEILEVTVQRTPVNQRKSEIIEDSEETGAQPICSKQSDKENDEEIIQPNATKQTAEPAKTFADEVKVPKENSQGNNVVEESVKSIEEEVQASEFLNEKEVDASVHQTPAEENIEEQQIETPTFSRKQQPANQKEEEPICKSTLESKLSIDEKVTSDAQPHVGTVEERKVKQTDTVESPASKQSEVDQISKVTESAEGVSQISVKDDSDLSENLETVEVSAKTQTPAKRRGRKPSRSKQQKKEETEENVSFVCTITTEKTTPLEELELSDEKKAITVTSNFEESSSDGMQTKADPAVATSTRHKTEKEFYKKVNNEICLSESAETGLDVKTDKPVDLELPEQSEKLLIDDKCVEQSEVVDIATGTALHEEIDVTETNSIAEEVHEPRRARRIRKASQSSHCSVHDEDHLPTTTTRRRGGRRRADTPLENIATEVTTSDAPTVKRRRQSQDKVVENKQKEEIQVVQIDESEIATVEEDVIEIGNTSEESGASIEDHGGNTNNDVKKADDDKLEEAVSSATRKEQNVDSENATISRGPIRRRHVAKTTDKTGDAVVKDSQHSDVNELSHESAATKRSRPKQTHSESRQTSVTIENTESHATKRRRRGYNATSDKSTINESMGRTENNLLQENAETSQIKEDDTKIVPVLQTVTKAVETEVSRVAEDVVKREPDTVKTESKTEEDHSTAADTSKRTRNMRMHKTSDMPKSSKELPDETNDIKAEHDQKTVVKLEEPLKNTAVSSLTRVNQRKKAETDDEHHDKTEETEVHKDEGTLEKETQNKIEVAEQAVVETTNTIAESVGGRRGRRGAAAVATVAINEVSSAHKRGAVRCKSHKNKSQATRKEEEIRAADTKLQIETATDHDEMLTVVEEKKQLKSLRRRRISLKEIQASHGDTAEGSEGVEKIKTEDDAGSSMKVAPKRSCKRHESDHAGEQETLNYEESTSAPSESASAAPTKQRGRRKRKDSHQNINDVVVGDEPPKKRPLSRKRRDSSLDSSIHEGTGMDIDINHGANTSSSSTTPQRPRRAAAAQDRNYDESSDAEAQVDLKRRIEKASLPKASTSSTATTTASPSKQRSPTTAKTPTKEMVTAEITDKTTSTPILSTVITTSRGRQRKPTARVQQYLEEERAKAETPKKRLLIGSAAVGDTPTSQTVGTPARRTRKTSTVEMVGSETVHTPARSRTRTAKALHVAETLEESRSEREHTHSELETTHSSSLVEEKEQKTKAKVTKRPTRGRGKHPIATAATTTVENEMSAEPTEATHCGRVGRAAKAAAAAALITDDSIGSHTKARAGRTRRGADIVVNEVVVQPSDVEVKEVRTEVVVTPAMDVEQTNKKTRKVAAGRRTTRGGRGRKKQDHEDNTDEHTTQHSSLAEGEASRSNALQQPPQLPIIADADDEHEDDEETLTTEAADIEVAKSLAGAKLAGKKRTAATRKAAAAVARTEESPVPKRSRRRAVAATSVEEDDAISHLDTRAESAASGRSRKVVRFDAATPTSVASATMSVDTGAEETEEPTSTPAAPAKRATRSRRK